MKWRHVRKGIILGEIVQEMGEFVDIKLSAKAKVANNPDPFRYGISPVYADEGCLIRVRRSFLKEIEDETNDKRTSQHL